MAAYLRNILCQIKVENGHFCSTRDEHAAMEICKWNSLHSMLETVNSFNQISGDKFGPKNEKYLYILTVLIKSAPDKWIQTFVDGFNDENTCGLCINSIRAVAKCAEICNKFDECDAEGNIYEDYVKRVSIALVLLQALLTRVSSCGAGDDLVDSSLSVTHVAFFLFIVSVQHLDASSWTTTASRTLANDCIQLINKTLVCATTEDFLLKDLKHPTSVQESEFKSLEKKCVIGKILLLWKPYLSRSLWKQYPSIANGFSYCLHQLKFPSISPFLELILPPCLLFVDDYVIDNKEMGLSCLVHILGNSGSEEIRWYGRADVIYEALKLQLHSTEETILKQTHEALLLILKVIVKDAHKLDVRTKYDEIFSLILQAAYQENKLVLRRVHTEHLSKFIELIGINVVKYMKELLDVFEEYLDIEDAPSEKARLNVLSALKTLISVAWPRIPVHSIRILKFLVKFIHHVTSGETKLDDSLQTELLALATDCLMLLRGLDCERMQECLQTLNCESLPFSTKCKDILKHCEQDRLN